MHIKSIFFLLFLLSVKGIAQQIPSNRQVDWEEALQSYEYTSPLDEVNVLDFGATGDGLTDDWQAIKNAIDSFEGKLGSVYFPAGIYLINQPIVLPDSLILKGEGAGNTSLEFDLGNENKNCIIIRKNQENTFFGLDDGYTKGSTMLISDSAFLFDNGDYAEIRQENGEWDDKPINWGDYAVGQILRIAEVIGDTIYLEQALRIDYQSELNPQIREILPLANSGLQCLKIHRADQPESGGGANIFFSFAANCFVRGVESDTSAGSHIDLLNCLNVLIDGNYIHHAFAYDGASKHGYGITLNNHSSACLITNNIFKHLRHAMMVKTGANGNVFSYNYSIEPVRSEWPYDYGGDISLHGHFPFANLFEGNIVQNITTDHYWGPSGPLNTIFRNRAALYGIIMTNGDPTTSDSQNYVGNETTDDSFLHGLYSLTGADHFEYGNSILGNVVPTGTSDLNDSSYYLESKPEFWSIDDPWPSIGLPMENGTGTIPAQQRYINGDFTICPDSVVTSTLAIPNPENEILVWPNPAYNELNIELAGEDKWQVKIINLQGQTIMGFEIAGFQKISLNRVQTGGVYLLVFQNGTMSFYRKIMITRK